MRFWPENSARLILTPTMSSVESTIEQSIRSAQLEELRLKNEKLKMEVQDLRKGRPWYQVPMQFVPIATALITIAGFWIGLFRYQSDQAERFKHEQEAREREFMKPWLENQREIYRKALSAVAVLANTENADSQKKMAEQFWSLYHGEMILVETKAVSDAMVAFGKCLDGSKMLCTKPALNDLALNLGTAMHESMASSAKMTYEEFSSNQFKYE